MRKLSALVAIMLAAAPLAAQAGPVLFDQDVTPDIIFGSGNVNGSFTTNQMSGVELGLRAKLRFDAANSPQNVFNSNGDGTYTFKSGQPPTGFGFAPGSPSTAVWNFEWSINSDYDGTSGLFLDDLTYALSIDFDPGPGTNFLTFDVINDLPVAGYWDHAIGTNATPNGGGTSAGDNPTYLALIAANNVAQNSWNMEFFDDAGGGFPFNANQNGTYEFVLTAFSGLSEVASTAITINAVPEPSSLALLGLGTMSIIGCGWRRKRRSAR